MRAMQQQPSPWTPPNPLPLEIATERLLLRPATHDDAADIFEAIQISRPVIDVWTDWAGDENNSLATCHYTIERDRKGHNLTPVERVNLAVFERQSSTYLGAVGLHSFSPNGHQGDIGYWVRADWHRRGIATEADRGLLDAAFADQSEGGWGLRRIQICCSARNAASFGVPEKLGLTREARLRQHRWARSVGWDDSLVYAVLADEWRK